MLIDTPARWRPGPTPAPGGSGAPDAVVIDGVTVQFPDQLAVDDISLVVPAGDDPRPDRAVGRGQDDDDPGPDRAPWSRPAGTSPCSARSRATSGARRASGSATCPSRSRSTRTSPSARTSTSSARCSGCSASRGGAGRSEVLKLVDLWDVRSRRAGELSGGMQRRLELACALVHDPALLFLDEPTAGIDPLLRARVWDELHRLRDAGRTLIVTTQYVNEAESCDTVALISERPPARARHARRPASPGGRRRHRRDRDRGPLRRGRSSPACRSSGSVRQDGPRQLTVVVDDAGTALPDVVEAVRARGGEVASAREERPSFDDVFAALVERDEAARPRRRPRPSAEDDGRAPRTPIDGRATEAADGRAPRRRRRGRPSEPTPPSMGSRCRDADADREDLR